MFTIWFTGLPSSGKTTLAKLLNEKINRSFVIDGDKIRNWLCPDLGFSRSDRIENIRRIRHLCNVLNNFDVISIVSAITPYEIMRIENRKTIKNYFEIYLSTPLDICIDRDVKGMYKLALNNKIKKFTGVSDPFETPVNADLILDTSILTQKQCIDKIIASLSFKFENLNPTLYPYMLFA